MKSVLPRKKPSQDRAKNMVNKILAAAAELINSEDEVGITTTHIADKAGISVGSLYQYFPNKEAVICELYVRILAKIRTTFDQFKRDSYLNLPRDEFFDKLFRALKRAEKRSGLTSQIENVMTRYPTLAQVDREHADMAAAEIAFFLRRFGAKWSDRKLHRVALFTYYINAGGWGYRSHVQSHTAEGIEWEINAYKSTIEQCFS